jgi:hypothetical protein
MKLALTAVVVFTSIVAGSVDLAGTWTLRWEPDFSDHIDEYDCTLKQSGRELTLNCRDDDPVITGELEERRVTLRFKAGRDGRQTATLTGEVNESATAVSGTWHLSDPENRDGKFTLTKR